MADPIFFETADNVTLPEPPIAQAAPHWDAATHTLAFLYNGRALLSVTVPGDQEFGYRHSSDGSIQSLPFMQQLYFNLDRPTWVTVRFHLSPEAVTMRPVRAPSEHAISGQVGTPLPFGINGLYDIRQDLLIDWHGRPWRWVGEALKPDETGDLVVELEVELGPIPWYMNLKMQYYRMHLGYGYHTPWEFRPKNKPISGWCSWEAYRREVSQAHVEAAAVFFAESLRPYGLEYIQIDDGFEKTPIPHDPTGPIAANWLNTNDQFPRGHAGAIAAIAKRGLQPGIWTSASLTNEAFAGCQPDVVVKDAAGKPFQGDWLGYVLDCEPATLAKHVLPYYQGLREMGYTYFKTDQIRHLLYDGLHKAVRMGVMSNADAERRFRAFMACARHGIGDEAFFLASWGVLSQAVGLVDACRISLDANPTWAGVRMQIVESARWYHTQRILFINDPDHICARARLEWARSISSLASLSGQLFMLSDPLEAYDADRLRMLQRCLPPLTTVTGETGALPLDFPAYTWTKLHGFAVKRDKPVAAEDVSPEDALAMAGEHPTMHDAHPFSSLWAFHFRAPVGGWHVVGRFATVPLQASEVPLERVGVDPAATYHVFDFWAQQYLGTATGALACRALELGHCQILGVRRVEDRPQCIASSRHVSMDAVSVRGERWDGRTLTLELSGVPGTTETYWIALPAGTATPVVAGATLTRTGNLLRADVTFTTSAATVTFTF